MTALLARRMRRQQCLLACTLAILNLLWRSINSVSAFTVPLMRVRLDTKTHDNFRETRRMRIAATPASFETFASEQMHYEEALNDLLRNWNEDADIAFLFVGQYHADKFAEIVKMMDEKIAGDTDVVAVLGGGCIGGGSEYDSVQMSSMSLMTGILPEHSQADIFSLDAGKEEESIDRVEIVTEDPTNNSGRQPSYVVFADPFSPLDQLLQKLDEPSEKNPDIPPAVVAGGISVPKQMNQASLALNGKLLRPGSFVGVSFTGNVGLLAVVAQGCRPVGPTFVITEASGTVLTGLSGETAISQLEDVANKANEQDQELIRMGELVCGIGSISEGISTDLKENRDKQGVPEEDDFLIRQIMGFQPKSGSILVAAGGLKEGNTFRFHVRAAQSAKEDMDLMIQRAKTERLFASSGLLKKGSDSVSVSAGRPLAALQISCVARGMRFFNAPNVDLKKVEALFQDGGGASTGNEATKSDTEPSSPPIAGFFANGEIGPVGIRMAEMNAKSHKRSDGSSHGTFLHGFTTVVALLCDYSETESSLPAEGLSSDTIISTMDDAWA